MANSPLFLEMDSNHVGICRFAGFVNSTHAVADYRAGGRPGIGKARPRWLRGDSFPLAVGARAALDSPQAAALLAELHDGRRPRREVIDAILSLAVQRFIEKT